MVFQKLSNINGGVDLKETFSDRESTKNIRNLKFIIMIILQSFLK